MPVYARSYGALWEDDPGEIHEARRSREVNSGLLHYAEKLAWRGSSQKESLRKRKESEIDEGILSTLSTAKTGSTSKITLTDEDKAVLKTLCKEEIANNTKLCEQMIQDKIRNSTPVRYMVLVKDKVWNLQRWICRKQKVQAPLTIDSLPVADPLERTAKYVSSGGKQSFSLSSMRIKWSDEDISIIRKKFGPLYVSSIGKVTKADIHDPWERDPILQAIFEREETHPGQC